MKTGPGAGNLGTEREGTKEWTRFAVFTSVTRGRVFDVGVKI